MKTFNTKTGALATRFGKHTNRRIEEIQQILIKLRDTLPPKLISGELKAFNRYE